MALAQIIAEGNLTADPELKFTPSGAAVVNFRIACTERRKNPQTEEWEDGDKSFYAVEGWRQLAENCAESLQKGTRVLVIGRQRHREYTNKDGQDRIAIEIKADLVSVVLNNQTASVAKAGGQGGGAARQAGAFQGQGAGYGQQPAGAAGFGGQSATPAAGAWGAAPAAPAAPGIPTGNAFFDEAPF